MGKRGPTAKGEYHDKSKVLSTRISAELREALELVAKDRGGTLSREIEHRLRRTFDDDRKIDLVFGSRRMFQLMRLIASVIESTVNRKIDVAKKPNLDWLDDPYAYDQAMRAIIVTLETMRPQGKIPQSLDEAIDQYGGTFQGDFNALATLRDVQKAPDALPVNGSRYRKMIAGMKKDIGDLVDRAVTYGQTADQVRSTGLLVQNYSALQSKEKKTPQLMTDEERKQLKALKSEIKKIQGGDE